MSAQVARGQRSGDQLAACEERIAHGQELARRGFMETGTALGEIREGKLWMASPALKGRKTTWAVYCEARWGISDREADRAAEAAAVVHQISDKLSEISPLPAVESHARALAAVRMELRAGVWERVVEQTGGRPTAKAIEAAGREATADFEESQPVTEQEKKVYGKAYEAARPAGGGQPAYDAAGREAVAAYRREHPAAPGKPEQTAGKPRKQGKRPVSADHTPNSSKTAEDSEPANTNHGSYLPGPEPEPAGQVQESVKTGTAETAAAATERKPHVCRVFACPECGKTDTAFSEQAGKLMEELEQLRGKRPEQDEFIAGLEAEVTRLQEALRAARQAVPGNGTGMAGNTADSAHGNGQGTPEQYVDLVPDDLGEEPQVTPDDDWLFGDDPAPDYGASQVTARGRRR